MKILKWLVAVVLVLIAVVLVSLMFWGGHVIKHGVNAIGPQVLGVPVRLEQARFHPLRGYVSLSGLIVGNPEGFHTESLFDMQYLEIDLDVKSLFTDTINIERILIDAPQITVEAGMRGTNLGALLEQLESATDPDAPKEEDAPEEVDVGKTVIIKELILADARAQISATAMRGRVVPVQLSTITLNDLGGEDQSITHIVTEVLKAVADAVGAADGARTVTDAAGEGARAVTDAVGDGARGVRGMLGGERDEDEEDEEDNSVEPEAKVLDDLSEKADERLKEGASRIGDALGGLGTRRKEE